MNIEHYQKQTNRKSKHILHGRIFTWNTCSSIVAKIALILLQSDTNFSTLLNFVCLPLIVGADILNCVLIKDKSFFSIVNVFLTLLFSIREFGIFGTAGLAAVSSWLSLKVDLYAVGTNAMDRIQHAIDNRKSIRYYFVFYIIFCMMVQPNPGFDLSISLKQVVWMAAFFVGHPHHNHHHGVIHEPASEKQSPWKYDSDFQQEWIQTNMDSSLVVDLKFKNVIVIAVDSFSSRFFPTYQFDLPNALPNRQYYSSPDFMDHNDVKMGIKESESGSESEGQVVTAMPYLKSQLAFGALSTLRSSSTYWLKSLLSVLWGVFPLNVNFNLESGWKIPADCIPAVLKNQSEQFYSVYMQPCSSSFDAQRRILQQLCPFDEFIDAQYLKHSNLNDHMVDGDCFADHALLAPLKRIVESQHQEKRLFMFVSSSATGGSNRIAPKFRRYCRAYTTDDKVNEYLCALRQTDDFVKELLGELKQSTSNSNFMDETLFVVAGLRGTEMGFHSEYGTRKTWSEDSIQTPIMFLSYNGTLKNAPMPSFATHIDILPSLLDFLAVEQPESNQGMSLVRRFNTERPTVHLMDPGNGWIVVEQRNFKAVFDPSRLLEFKSFTALLKRCKDAIRNCDTDMLFDLSVDPDEEENMLSHWFRQPSPAELDIGRWFDHARYIAFHFVRLNRMKYRYFFDRS